MPRPTNLNTFLFDSSKAEASYEAIVSENEGKYKAIFCTEGGDPRPIDLETAPRVPWAESAISAPLQVYLSIFLAFPGIICKIGKTYSGSAG
jgi:hypothetical protein